MTFKKARHLLVTFSAIFLALSSSLFAEEKQETPECLAARKEIDLIWEEYRACIAEAEEAEFQGIKVDASKCLRIKNKAMEKDAEITDPYNACPNLTKGTFRNGFFVGPKFGHEMGYTSAGTGGFLMRFTASPMAGFFDTRDHSPEKGRSMEFAQIEVGVRYTNNIFTLDTLKVKVGEFQQYFIEHIGIELSHDIIWDTNRGQVANNWDGKLLLNLLKTALTSLYRGTHIVIGAGTRLQLRDFTVIQGWEQPVNFQVPVSLDVAFSFLKGKLTFGMFVEGALNPLRIRDHSIMGRVEGRYNVYTDIKDHTASATSVHYRIDLGAKYEIDYQNETALDYGKPTDKILGDKVVHRALGFFEILF